MVYSDRLSQRVVLMALMATAASFLDPGSSAAEGQEPINPAAELLNYSTFVGGSGWDSVHDLAMDNEGNIYLVGETPSLDFPATPDSWDTTPNGQGDIFVVKMDSLGNVLYSTYIGGTDWDMGWAIAVDDEGSAYVTGFTESVDFPTTPGAYDTVHDGSDCGGFRCPNAFVAKLDPYGSTLVYSTLLGTPTGEEGTAIAVDSAGRAFVVGYTSSLQFPVTPNAFDADYGGYGDAFLTVLDVDGSSLVLSTFIGGSSSDHAFDVYADRQDGAIVVGQTGSWDFPTTADAWDRSLNAIDGFVTKLDSPGGGLVYSTFLGGAEGDTVHSVKVDETGQAFVTGTTWSPDFPVTSGTAGSLFRGGDGDGFVAKLDPAGVALLYATYFGGSGRDDSTAIAIDSEGIAYVTGHTSSLDFPTTASAIQTNYAGGDYLGDSFIAAFSTTGRTLLYGSYLGGGGEEWGRGIAANVGPTVYVAGMTESSDFPISANAANPLFRNREGFVTILGTRPSPDGPPTAEAEASATQVHMGEPIEFDGRASWDDFEVVAYRWEFGDGSTASTSVAVHPYALRGTFLVTLVVMDSSNQTDTASLVIDVRNRGPTVDAGSDRTVLKRETVVLRAITADPDDDAVALTWSQLAGVAVELAVADGTNASFTPRIPGLYEFMATGDDGWGGVATDTVFVSVRNLHPSAVLSANHHEVAAGELVTLDGTRSTDPDGEIVAWSFEFGDGTRADGPAGFQNHRYTESGTYVVTMHVTDDDSAVATAQVTIEVLAVQRIVVDVVNWKPLIAAVFAATLALAGLWASTQGSRERRNGISATRTFLMTSAPFVAVEVATGIISAWTGALAIPPAIGAGTLVDGTILIAGLTVLLIRTRRAYVARLPSPAS